MSTQPVALAHLIDQANVLAESYINGNLSHVVEQLEHADPVLVVLFTACLCEHFRLTAERDPLDVGVILATRLRVRSRRLHDGG